MIRRPPRSTPLYSSAASDVYKRQRQSRAPTRQSKVPKRPPERQKQLNKVPKRLPEQRKQLDKVPKTLPEPRRRHNKPPKRSAKRPKRQTEPPKPPKRTPGKSVNSMYKTCVRLRTCKPTCRPYATTHVKAWPRSRPYPAYVLYPLIKMRNGVFRLRPVPIKTNMP